MDYKKAYQELSQVVMESDNLGLMSKLRNMNRQSVPEGQPPKKADYMKREERKQAIMNEKDATKRQKLIQENMELFKGEK